MAQQEDWAALAAVLRRVLSGERGDGLLEGLDPIDTAIAAEVLARLAQPPLVPPAGRLMTKIIDTIQALTDDQAARVLALTVDHAAPLPDPAQLRALDSALRDALSDDAELGEYASPAGQAADSGDLAKTTLCYLATSRPDLVPIIARSVELADDSTREPALFVGALVVLALQTEVKLTRDSQGKWSFTMHKRPLRDSTLGQVITKLISTYFFGGN